MMRCYFKVHAKGAKGGGYRGRKISQNWRHDQKPTEGGGRGGGERKKKELLNSRGRGWFLSEGGNRRSRLSPQTDGRD